MSQKLITACLIKTWPQGIKLRQENLFLSSLCCDYLGPEFLNRIRWAYRAARIGHEEQLRDNGEPYFSHLCNTTGILVNELKNRDGDLICACLLHDILEDSDRITFSLIKGLFGKEVAKIVVGVTKPKRSDKRFTDDKERHQFYFAQIRKADSRIKLLKLCDRLHAVRTFWKCHPDKQKRKIEETKAVYLPLIDDISEDYSWEARYLRHQFAFSLRSLSFWENEFK